MKLYEEEKQKIDKDLAEIKDAFPLAIKKIQEDLSCIKKAVEILLEIKSKEIVLVKQIVQEIAKKEDLKSH